MCLLNEDLSVGRVAEGMETWGFESLAYGSVDLKKEMYPPTFQILEMRQIDKFVLPGLFLLYNPEHPSAWG